MRPNGCAMLHRVEGEASGRVTLLWQQIWRRKPVTVMTDETGTDTGER